MPTKTVLLKTVLLIALLLPIQPVLAAAEASLEYYLGGGTSYDPAVAVPASVLGWEVGTWHVRHDLLVAYLRKLAETSDRVEIEVTGKTHEDRPLLLLTISSPQNLARIDEIWEAHLRLSDPTVPRPDTSEMPVVVYLGYSIHGNEASGSNTALLMAYHLAASQGNEVAGWLENAVILLDPSLNPDGLSRFAQWANMHRGHVLVADAEHREHREGWPSGRTNHYWFDLNRDWLPLVHPESQARLRSFHRFKPNVLIDAHEMGSDRTYFFQPGIPSRQNPLTPARNLELTREIAGYHAEALDEIGSLYFTEEMFDDFYYGKGSTYPDVNGTIGILFEQGSVRGHLRESINGELSFPFAIRNQLATSLSTMRAATALREKLLGYQADFFRDALEQAEEDDLRAYVFGDPHDRVRTHALVTLLERHRLEVHPLARPLRVDDLRFEPGLAFVVPLAQPQYRLIRAFFETRVDFADTSFYDVSTWTLPLAYDLPYASLDRKSYTSSLIGEGEKRPEAPRGRFPEGAERVVAYALDWDSYLAPRTLYRLLAAGVRCRVAAQPFKALTTEGPRDFDYGAIVVPLGIQEEDESLLAGVLREGADGDGVDVWALTTGLTPEGIDIGSPNLRPVELPKPALLVGGKADAYEAGEVWHLLDRRFEIPLVLLEEKRVAQADLDRYTHLILVDGEYGHPPEEWVERLRTWVRGGGVLVATKGGAVWVDKHLRKSDGGPDESAERDDAESPGERFPYAERRKRRQAEVISGAIFEVDLDVTHPIAYGFRRPSLPVFRNSTIFLKAEKDPYVTVARYTSEPLLSGYVSAANLEKLRGTPAVVAEPVGEGAYVRMADNPNFRGFWYGTNKLFMNALFFGPIVDSGRGRR